MTAHATVYKRGDQFVVASSSLTESGFLVVNGWYRILDAAGATDESLGEATLAALTSSSGEVPDPPRSADPFKSILDALSLKTFNAFAKNSRSVKVTGDVNVLTVTPTRNGGPREGFKQLRDQQKTVTNRQPVALGAAIAAAFELSE